jgi:hypothetical protein
MGVKLFTKRNNYDYDDNHCRIHKRYRSVLYDKSDGCNIKQFMLPLIDGSTGDDASVTLVFPNV